jgi:transcriptional regulator with XRE-family HTH domain
MCRKHTQLKSLDDFAAISDYVAYIRELRGYTLREVVELVATAITHKALPVHCSLSQAYLSNLEAGKYGYPSPFKLQALAYVYHISYESLLQKAGYLQQPHDDGKQDILFTLMLKEVQDLTQEEVQALLEYIDFMKFRRTKHCEKCHQEHTRKGL